MLPYHKTKPCNIRQCFRLALVLFEFSVVSAMTLVQPATLAITQEFGCGSAWAPLVYVLLLIGWCLCCAILGPLSDRLGRKKVLLGGVAFLASYA